MFCDKLALHAPRSIRKGCGCCSRQTQPPELLAAGNGMALGCGLQSICETSQLSMTRPSALEIDEITLTLHKVLIALQ